MSDIDTSNEFCVAALGGDVVVPLHKPCLTRAQALRLAAWIVAISDPLGEDFSKVLEAVKNT